MQIFSRKENRKAVLLGGFYFAIAVIEVVSELYAYKPMIYVFKPLMPFVLMVLYFVSSKRKSPLFFAVMTLSLITNVLFIPDSPEILFYGLIVFLLHRILLLYYILRLLRISDYVPTVIASVPFLLVNFYLFLITNGIPENSFFVLIFQNILISFICGVSFAHYVMQDSRRHSWLLQSGILFGVLHFIVFVERFYLTGFSPEIFRPIAMGLNAFAFYAFYEFVMATERSDSNDTGHIS